MDLTMLDAILRAAHLNAPVKMIAVLVATWLHTYHPDRTQSPRSGQLSHWPVIAGVLATICHTNMPTGLNVYRPYDFKLSKHRYLDNPKEAFSCWEHSSEINLLEYCDGSYVALIPGPRPRPPMGDWWYVPNPRMPADPQNKCWLCHPPERPIEATTAVGNRQADRFPAWRIPWRAPCGEFRVFVCRKCACRELLRLTTGIMDQTPTEELTWDLLDALAGATNNHRDNFRWQNRRRDP